ncbi:MAG: hypothetical protein V4477_16730 [Pseudomonadota bacterium]
MTTATQVQLRRGTAAQVAAFTGAQGEVTPDMTNRRLVLHDGSTVGGFPQASESYVQTQIAALTAGNSTNLLLGRTCV